MGGYAGDGYTIASKRERRVLTAICCVAALLFFTSPIWSAWFYH
jgi:hypothetical protein